MAVPRGSSDRRQAGTARGLGVREPHTGTRREESTKRSGQGRTQGECRGHEADAGAQSASAGRQDAEEEGRQTRDAGQGVLEGKCERERQGRPRSGGVAEDRQRRDPFPSLPRETPDRIDRERDRRELLLARCIRSDRRRAGLRTPASHGRPAAARRARRDGSRRPGVARGDVGRGLASQHRSEAEQSQE